MKCFALLPSCPNKFRLDVTIFFWNQDCSIYVALFAICFLTLSSNLTYLLCYLWINTVIVNCPEQQSYSFTICSVLRLFFSCSIICRIEFWDCSSNTEWSLYKLVYNDMINIKVVARLHPATSINTLCSKSILSYLNTWKISSNYSTIQGYYFLTLRSKNYRPL